VADTTILVKPATSTSATTTQKTIILTIKHASVFSFQTETNLTLLSHSYCIHFVTKLKLNTLSVLIHSG
jgi:hypothetical protein